MTDDLYIWIPNWDGPDGFQHYKERDPIWIKNYTRLMSHDAYTALSYHQRGILHSIWMEYARANRQLRGSTLSLTRQLGHRVLTRDIEALNHAGFIELLASTELQERLHSTLALARVKAEAEAETETEPSPTPPANGRGSIKLTQKDLRRYTGCKHTRGTHGQGYKHTPLGTDKPPPDWPHDKPTRAEVEAALADAPIAF